MSISATRDYLKSQIPETLNRHSCATSMPKRESCGGVLRSGLPPLDPIRSINYQPPLMHSACRPAAANEFGADIKSRVVKKLERWTNL
jgi:hypothetical protein